MKKDLTCLQNLSSNEILHILDLSEKLKKDRSLYRDFLKGKTVGLLFQKPSNRTRVSFEVGVYQLGGNCFYLGPNEINLGVRESTEDVARTLSRYLDCIVARTNSHQDILDLAKFASVPIINGLSDFDHPCQALADILTVKEKFGKTKDVTLAYIGDGNNVCNSLLTICSKVGTNIHIATPSDYRPNPSVLKEAESFARQSGCKIMITDNPEEAVKDVNVIYSDVWVSMGQESEELKRLKDFKGYQINKKLASLAHKDYFFMHCLPAHRGQEVTSDVIDNEKHSIIFDQAENRLHVQKAVLIWLMEAVK